MRQPLRVMSHRQINIWLEIFLNISLGLVGTRCNTSGVAEAPIGDALSKNSQVIHT